MTVLKEQVLAVIGRREFYQAAEDYYEGDVPEVFATSALRNAMRKAHYDSRLNFCRPVVDAVQNRLEISAVMGTSKEGQAVIDATWEFNDLAIDYNEAHRKALVYGDCYVMVWPDEEGNLEISYNTPLTTALVYDVEHPRRKSYAVKMWETEDGTRLNLYYADRIEKYFVKNKTATEGSQWNLLETDENPFGVIPVFHLRTMRPTGRPEHVDAFDAQNYINKQFIQSMYVSDYQGAPQRYAVSQAGAADSNEIDDFQEGDTKRENDGALKNGPGELWALKGFSQVGQFQPANPAVFWEPIKDTVRAMASLTSTPLHYFEKTGNVPSGQALRVAEAPLIKKVSDRQLSFGQTWREIFKFVLKVSGINEDVQIKWKDVESMDSLERLDAGLKKRNIGLSTAQVMREDGYDEEVIAQVLAEAKAERDAGLAGYQLAPQTRVNTNADVRNVQNG
jgi:hypothetical protein